eukprot:TRINITY_DN2156_c0_g1_i2.p1 TRINITY_DN2156_c0_g1~~TRINITY_DN2156_c0_g1_i2.p1  ORF type:complete len:511 (+),score=174.95 TRINITY_DN2156_c0_g1_i2:97-1629(+)
MAQHWQMPVGAVPAPTAGMYPPPPGAQHAHAHAHSHVHVPAHVQQPQQPPHHGQPPPHHQAHHHQPLGQPPPPHAAPPAAPMAHGHKPFSTHTSGDYGTSDCGTDEQASASDFSSRGGQQRRGTRAGRKGRVPRRSGYSSGERGAVPPAQYAGSSSDGGGGEFSAAPWLRHTTLQAYDAARRIAAGDAPVPPGAEIEDFAEFMQLTAEEKASRNMLRSALQDGAQQLWPSATVKVYGSFAYGLSLPSSEVDIVIEDCQANLQETLDPFQDWCKMNGCEILGSMAGNAQDAFMKVRSQNKLIANVTLTAGRSLVRQSVAKVKSLLQQYPCAGPLILVIRSVLNQCNLNDVPTGGLSSFAITLMVFHFLQARYTAEEAQAKDGGDALKDFLHFYGDFNFETHAVAVSSQHRGPPTLRPHGQAQAAQVCVCDPLEADNNVADTCTKIAQIRAMFKYCSMALSKWDAAAGSAANPGQSFRGRTPLSTIIAHKQLWGRRKLQERQVFAAAAAVPR